MFEGFWPAMASRNPWIGPSFGRCAAERSSLLFCVRFPLQEGGSASGTDGCRSLSLLPGPGGGRGQGSCWLFVYILFKRCVESRAPNDDLCRLKVTSKKVLAAGQWSGAVVSSLFASKPQQPAAKDPASASSPPQVHAHETHPWLTSLNSRSGFR